MSPQHRFMLKNPEQPFSDCSGFFILFGLSLSPRFAGEKQLSSDVNEEKSHEKTDERKHGGSL